MTQKEKQLLLIDLCARLPYEVKIATQQYNYCNIVTPKGIVGDRCYFNNNPRYDGDCSIDKVKPYLRPMSSMTEEERKEVEELIKSHKPSPDGIINNEGMDNLLFSVSITSGYLIDWLTKKMFDYRGLIPMSLALEALKDMYRNGV